MENNRTSDYVFKAYVVNTAAYDAGEREDSGAWLYFPPHAGEVPSLLEKIGLPPDAAPGNYFMDDYVSHVHGLKDILPMYGDIQELSEVARAISSLSPEDRELLAAVQESPHRLASLEQLREFPKNTEYFILGRNVRSEADLGWRYVEYLTGVILPDELLHAIDSVPFGKFIMKEEEGCFTSVGYLCLSGDAWRHEHEVEPSAWEPEKKPSIRERLEQGKKECANRQAQPQTKGKSEPEL